MPTAILTAAEALFAARGYSAVSIRDIADEVGTSPGSVTYHFGSKDALLLAIYQRHCEPMNRRRIDLLAAAQAIGETEPRLKAILRAWLEPAFVSNGDRDGGGASFSRLRAVMSAEGNPAVGRIIAATFDDTTRAFMMAFHHALPHLSHATIVWRCQFLLGSLYYTLVAPDRITRLGDGAAAGGDTAAAIEHLVAAFSAAFQAPDPAPPWLTVRPSPHRAFQGAEE